MLAVIVVLITVALTAVAMALLTHQPLLLLVAMVALWLASFLRPRRGF